MQLEQCPLTGSDPPRFPLLIEMERSVFKALDSLKLRTWLRKWVVSAGMSVSQDIYMEAEVCLVGGPHARNQSGRRHDAGCWS